MMYDELIKRLRYAADAEAKNHPTWNELMKEAADAIEELLAEREENYADSWKMAFEVERDTHRWIPVTERLPNCNGCYLVWRPHFFGGEIGMPSICYFDGTNTWHDSYGVDFTRILHSEDVTHWMPLPQSPKDGES